MNVKKTVLLYTFFTLGASSALLSDIETKVVTVSGQKIIQESETGKKIQKELQEEQEKLSKPLQKDQATVQKKEKELMEKKKKLDKEAEEIASSKILSQDAKQRKYEELQDTARELEEDKAELERSIKRLQADAKKLDSKMSQMYQEKMNNFDAKIKEVIKHVAEKNNWDVVLMEESVVFAHPKVSQTNTIIKELDGRDKTEKLNKVKNKPIRHDHEDENSNSDYEII